MSSTSRQPVSIAAKVCAVIWITAAAAALFFGDWRLLAAGFLAAFLAAVISAPVRKSQPEKVVEIDKIDEIHLGDWRRPKGQG